MGERQGRRRLARYLRTAARLTILILGLVTASCGPADLVSTGLPPKATPTGPLAIPASPEPAARPVTPTLPAPTAPTCPIRFEPAQANYSIPLTAQYVGETRAALFFEMEAPGRYTLMYWTEGDPPESGGCMSLEENVRGGVILLEDLEPGHIYQAAVVLVDEGEDGLKVPAWQGGLWDPISFRTQPAGGLPLRLAVIGDTGFGEAVTRQLVDGIAAHQPDAVIHTGDLVYNVHQEGSAQAAFQAKFYTPFAPVLHRAPLYPVLGNHEYYPDALANGLPYYQHAFASLQEYLPPEIWQEGGEPGRGWYAFGIGPYQFIMLDSQAFYQPRGAEDQTRFLTEKLADERYRASILVFHIPPYTSGRHASDGIPIQRHWLPLLEGSNVMLLLSGHDHNYERLALNGVTSIVAGAGSSHLYPMKERLAQSRYFAAVPSYVILDLDHEGVRARAFDVQGELLDQIELPMPPE